MKIFELENHFDNYTTTDFYRQFGNAIFHNAKSSSLEGFIKFKWRDKPQDTSNAFHNEVNKLSKEKFGLPVRNLLFALPSKIGADNINHSGTTYNVYPVSSDFSIFISESTVDMTVDYDATSDDIANYTRLKVEQDLYRAFKEDEYHTAVEKQQFMVYISSKIDALINSNDINNKSGTLDSLITKTFNDIKDVVINKGFEKYIDIIEDSMLRSKVYYQNKALSYVKSIKKVNSRTEIDYYKFVELMVYDPEGFIFKKV